MTGKKKKLPAGCRRSRSPAGHILQANLNQRLSIAILAGGRSSRMGRDKARLQLGSRSLLTHVRTTAKALGLPIRVIRKDIIPPCGPLGGIYTALHSSRAEAVLFLACDMPFVTEAILRRIIRHFRPRDRACFATLNGRAGFPFIIRSEDAEIIAAEIQAGRWSLQQLVGTLRARPVVIAARDQAALGNLNTREELLAARKQRWASSRSPRPDLKTADERVCPQIFRD